LPLLGLIALVVAFAVAQYSPAAPSQINPLSRDLPTDSSGRTSAWSLVLALWQQRPFIGWGFGTVDQIFPTFATAISDIFSGGSAHDAYLQALFEVGPVGVLVILFAISLALRQAATPAADFFEAGVFGAVVAGFVNQLFESGITSPGSIIAFNFWLLVMACISLRRLPARVPTPTVTKGALHELDIALTLVKRLESS
jgi:O-antigen ligase